MIWRVEQQQLPKKKKSRKQTNIPATRADIRCAIDLLLQTFDGEMRFLCVSVESCGKTFRLEKKSSKWNKFEC